MDPAPLILLFVAAGLAASGFCGKVASEKRREPEAEPELSCWAWY